MPASMFAACVAFQAALSGVRGAPHLCAARGFQHLTTVACTYSVHAKSREGQQILHANNRAGLPVLIAGHGSAGVPAC